MTTTVHLVYGIDYGLRGSLDPLGEKAWAWWNSTDNAIGKRCMAATANGGDTQRTRLVVFSMESSAPIWDGEHDPDDPHDAVVDVAEWMQRACSLKAETQNLKAFCDEYGLPWREPRWFIVTDQSR